MTEPRERWEVGFCVFLFVVTCGYVVFGQFVLRDAISAAPTSPLAVVVILAVLTSSLLIGSAFLRLRLTGLERICFSPEFVAVRVMAAIGTGGYIALSFRTWGLGFSLPMLAGEVFIALLFASPLVLLAAWSASLRKSLLSFAAIILAAVLAAEVAAGIEEAIFRSESESATTEVQQNRWWPFRHHELLYDPDEGRWWGNC